jgi:hypothetical protein
MDSCGAARVRSHRVIVTKPGVRHKKHFVLLFVFMVLIFVFAAAREYAKHMR